MRISVLMLLALVSSARPVENTGSREGRKQLQGTWPVVAFEVDGKELSPPFKKIVVTGDKLTGIGPEMTITVDDSKKPRWIDLSFKKGDKTFPIRAIYEINDNELKLCIPLAPKKGQGKVFENIRPENFTTASKPVMLIKARRTAE